MSPAVLSTYYRRSTEFVAKLRSGTPSAEVKSNPLQASLRMLFVAIVSFCFVGCRVGPRYKAPAITLQPFVNAPAVQKMTSDGPPTSLDHWWTGFKDPQLTAIIERAIAQNLDLAASLARVAQARAAAKEVGAKLKPSVNLAAQSNSFRQSLDSPVGRYAGAFPTFDRNQSYLDLGVAATWEMGGADIRFIQQMLGHASLAATELYTHVSIRMLKQVHAATHPAAHLEKKKPSPQIESDDAAREELLATLDAEAESETTRNLN
jgi:Outer membrane efflux protein